MIGPRAATPHREIADIAHDIEEYWRSIDNRGRVHVHMLYQLRNMDDTVAQKCATQIITEFLTCAKNWHGEHADRIKEELRDLLEGHS